MNCKDVNPLLPLYVGGDLEQEHSRLVAAHLQACTECALTADEYAGASQLLQGYEPPFISDEIYTGIREQVLNEIKRESHAPARPGIFSQMLLAVVQPRMRWITAALLLAISVTALYLIRKPARQLRNDQQVAIRSEITDESAGSSSFSNQGQVRTGAERRPATRKRKTKAGVVAVNRSRQLNKTQPSSDPAPLRVEMQTTNRNIRIIWLSAPRPGAGGSEGSKGI
jgi:anti-sigma factor RsiW